MKAESKIKRRGDRNDLVGEHPWGDAGQLILFVIFLVVWAVDSFLVKFSTFLSSEIPIYVRLPVALLIFSSAVYFTRSAHRILFEEISKQPKVIRNGVFNRVRHPLYLGSLLFYPGLFVLTLSILSFVLWLVIIAFYHWISRYEEKLLLDNFGAEYEKYMSEVPMWIPRLKLAT